MTLWYKDFGIEINGNTFKNKMNDFCSYLKNKYDENKKQTFEIALILGQTGYVQEVIKIKTTLKKLNEYLNNEKFLNVLPLKRPSFNVDIIERNELIEHSQENDQLLQDLNYESTASLSEDCIKIYF